MSEVRDRSGSLINNNYIVALKTDKIDFEEGKNYLITPKTGTMMFGTYIGLGRISREPLFQLLNFEIATGVEVRRIPMLKDNFSPYPEARIDYDKNELEGQI